MEQRNNAVNTATTSRRALKDLSLREFLKSECGYSEEQINARQFSMRVGSSEKGRGWLEFNGVNGMIQVFLSASGGHTLETVKERGFDLRVQLLPPTGESERTENAWFTSEPSGNTTEVSAADIFGGPTAGNEPEPAL